MSKPITHDEAVGCVSNLFTGDESVADTGMLHEYIAQQRARDAQLLAAGLIDENGEVRKVLGRLPVTHDGCRDLAERAGDAAGCSGGEMPSHPRRPSPRAGPSAEQHACGALFRGQSPRSVVHHIQIDAGVAPHVCDDGRVRLPLRRAPVGNHLRKGGVVDDSSDAGFLIHTGLLSALITQKIAARAPIADAANAVHAHGRNLQENPASSAAGETCWTGRRPSCTPADAGRS